VWTKPGSFSDIAKPKKPKCGILTLKHGRLRVGDQVKVLDLDSRMYGKIVTVARIMVNNDLIDVMLAGVRETFERHQLEVV